MSGQRGVSFAELDVEMSLYEQDKGRALVAGDPLGSLLTRRLDAPLVLQVSVERSSADGSRKWPSIHPRVFAPSSAALPLFQLPIYRTSHSIEGKSTQIAEWAGHSVAVLHQIYAKVIAGQESTALARIGDALGLDDATAGTHMGHRMPGWPHRAG